MIKKLLLILLFCSVAILSWGADIDVGSTPLSGSAFPGWTLIDNNNSANATGTIDHIEFYSNSSGTGQVATFIDEGSNVLSTRGYVEGLSISSGAGIKTYDAPGDFVAFNVNTGDYIGFISSSGTHGYSDGGGFWYATSDKIPASSQSFTLNSNSAASVYGEGTLAAVAAGQIIIIAKRGKICLGEYF